MSGPKCDQYVLAEQREEEARRRLQEKIRRFEEEKARKLEEERQRLEEERRRREEEKRRLEEERRRLEEELERKRQEELERQRIEEEKRRIEEEKRRLEEQLRMEQEAWNAECNRVQDEMRQLEEDSDWMLMEIEQEMVAEAIDETLAEMGYEVVATMGTETAKAQVFSFSEGTGIQVMEANGQISMEIVGLGTTNRRPTDEEGAYLEQQMQEFCEAYDELERRLQEKGVIRGKGIHHFPPNKKYARILNLEHFEKKTEKETLQTVMKREEKTKASAATQMTASQKKTLERKHT